MEVLLVGLALILGLNVLMLWGFLRCVAGLFEAGSRSWIALGALATALFLSGAAPNPLPAMLVFLGVGFFDASFRLVRALGGTSEWAGENLNGARAPREIRFEPVLCLPPPETACPVCGELLEGRVPTCMECDVPMHRDCKEFVRGCVTYGCGGATARH